MSQALTIGETEGRNSHYQDRSETVGEILHRLGQGESLVKVCQSPHMPGRWAIHEWADSDPQLADAIRRARELGEDAIAHDVLTIADNLSGDPQRDKLRVDTRMKLLAKFNPKRWGESTQLRHADAEGQKLDTGGLVTELLGLMGGAPGSAIGATLVAEAPAALERQSGTQAPARTAYRPRAPRVASGVDDLV